MRKKKSMFYKIFKQSIYLITGMETNKKEKTES